jgi:hypothetical protein
MSHRIVPTALTSIISKRMSPNPLYCLTGAESPLCIDWSDERAVAEHEQVIIEMATLWRRHEMDILGWQKLRDDAAACGEFEAMREFAVRATHSRWVRSVVMARLKFRSSGHDPYPNTFISSFSI